MKTTYTVCLPDLGEGVIEGEVVEWLKQVGDLVAKNEAVVTVMTDKATVELPSPFPGELARQHVKKRQFASLGHPLYDLHIDEHLLPQKREEQQVQKPKKPHTPTPPKGRVLAKPTVRSLAKELGVEIDKVEGTGRMGQITKKDLAGHIRQALPPIPHLEGDREETVRGIAAKMAAKMSVSKKMIPHFSYFEQVDATRLLQLKTTFAEKAKQEGIHVTFMPFFIKALSLTIDRFAEINASFNAEKKCLIYHEKHNIGIAMSTDKGLIVPVLKGVQHQPLEALIKRYEELICLAKNNQISPQQMSGSTVTISNYGQLGNALWATPIINYPESAILALNKITKQPLIERDQLVVKNALHLCWSFDHRIIDGNLAAKCSTYFGKLIKNPMKLLGD